MKKVFGHIAKLLENHSCVVIPSLGGFVVNDGVVACPAESGLFSPPSKEVIFNPILNHNDGLLVQEISQQEKISFDEANQIIINWVLEIKESVDQKGFCEVGDYGAFFKVGSRFSFKVKKWHLCTNSCYGLTDFYFPPLVLEQSVKKQTNRGASHLVWASAAAIALLLAFQPLNNSNHESQVSFSSIVTSDLLLKSELEKQKSCVEELKNELTLYKGSETLYYWIVADFMDSNSANAYILDNNSFYNDSLYLLKFKDRFCVVGASALSNEELMPMISEKRGVDSSYVLSVSKFID